MKTPGSPPKDSHAQYCAAAHMILSPVNQAERTRVRRSMPSRTVLSSAQLAPPSVDLYRCRFSSSANTMDASAALGGISTCIMRRLSRPVLASAQVSPQSVDLKMPEVWVATKSVQSLP